MKNFLLYLWQLPQNLLGLIVIKITNAKFNETRNIYQTKWKYKFGVSLGKYIIFSGRYKIIDVHHEQGHQKQSLYLGWLYLIIIGLPSVIGNRCKLSNSKYYKLPWERWADTLGNVKRK